MKTDQLLSVNKPRILANAMISGGEPAVRLMAQLIGAAPCPRCQFIHTHCKCK